MTYEGVIIFVSVGWFISVTVMFLMYVRMKQLSEELKLLKYTIDISEEEMKVLESGISDYQNTNI